MLNFILVCIFGSHLFASSLSDLVPTQVSEIDSRIEALSSRSNLTLVLGASPCEESIRVSRAALASSDSVCFLNNHPQAGDAAHPRYFNIDFNTTQLENFATRLSGKFKEVYFDWSVLKFFEYNGLSSLRTLLQIGGSLIIPQPSVGGYFGTTTGFLAYSEAEYDTDIRAYFSECTASMHGPLARIGTRSWEASRPIINTIFLEELTKRIGGYHFAPVLLSDTEIDAPMFELITKGHPEFLEKNIKVLQSYAMG
jgi:hypothetical protein